MPEKEALPSQQLISVDQIRDGVVVLKNGGMRAVLLASGINFELKSMDEQEAIILSFQEFLASLEFSLEIVIHSRKSNIENYLRYIEKNTQGLTNDLLQIQAQEYINFINSFVELYSVMQKKFFVIVPYSPVEISAEAAKGTLGSVLKKTEASKAFVKYSVKDFNRHRNQLWTRVDAVIAGLAKIGVRAIPLETEGLVELLYNYYNPQATEQEKEITTSAEMETL